MIANDRERSGVLIPVCLRFNLSVSARYERSIVTYFSRGEDRDLHRRLGIRHMFFGLRVSRTACELVLIGRQSGKDSPNITDVRKVRTMHQHEAGRMKHVGRAKQELVEEATEQKNPKKKRNTSRPAHAVGPAASKGWVAHARARFN